VLGLRPEFFKIFTIRITNRCDVINKGIKPYIGDILIIERQRDAPFQPCLGTGNAEVFQRLPEKSENFVAIPLRPDKSGLS